MNKRLTAAMLAVCIFFLSGCQLAQPEAQEEKDKDRLVGVFVTDEYLDLFDMEAYLNDHMDDIMSGSTTVEDHWQYSNKIFARRVEENGEVRYVFDDLEGILMASYLVKPRGNNLNEYWVSDASEGIYDVTFGHHSRDDGYDATHSGTIYISRDYGEASFYHNPVYQTPDGQVYLVAGHGISFISGDCSSTTQTLNEEYTQTENDAVESYTSKVEVTIEAVDPALSLVIIQMDEANRIITSAQYSISEAPTKLTVSGSTAYILVEEHTAQGIRRSLYQPGDDYITVFKVLESQLCVKAQTRIQWPQ